MKTKALNLNDARILASQRHGAVSRPQLRRCGVTARDEQAAVRAGHLSYASPSVLVAMGSPDSWLRRLTVGLLTLGPGAFVSHEAAAALLELDNFQSGPLTYTTLRLRRSKRLDGAVVHTTRAIGQADIIKIHGLRCSSATRTICDLAADGARAELVAAAIDSAIRLRRSALVVLQNRLAAVRGKGISGVRLLDSLLIDAGGESFLERAFLKLVREAGLPRPITQHRINADGKHVARVDFL